MTDDTQQQIIKDLLTNAIPVNPSPSGHHYVTHSEFQATVEAIESKIENSSLKTMQWVLAGCLAILVSGGSGYVSLVNKLDRLEQSLPVLAEISDARTPWIQRQEQRDTMQDEALKKLDKQYQPFPYQPPPR
jgi:hypothetical protein